MKKSIALTVFGIFLIEMLAQAASAYYGMDYYYMPHASYAYDPYNDAASVCLSANDVGCSPYYPDYRYHELGCIGFDCNQGYRSYGGYYGRYYDRYDWDDEWSGDDWRWNYEKRRAADWAVRSFDARYNYASGKTSGQAFGGDKQPAESSTNFRYKTAYDPWVNGVDSKNYYYKQNFDSNLEKFNWRF